MLALALGGGAAEAMLADGLPIEGSERAAQPADAPVNANAPFTVDHPASWNRVAESDLATMPGNPLAVLRREDGRGTVVIARRGPVGVPLDQMPRGLERTLSRRFSDFRQVGAKVISLGANRGLVYTFARTKSGTAQTLVVMPAGKQSFTLNAVVPRRSPDAAREVAAIIASFRPGR